MTSIHRDKPRQWYLHMYVMSRVALARNRLRYQRTRGKCDKAEMRKWAYNWLRDAKRYRWEILRRNS